MGRVFEAENLLLGRKVAIKVLRAEFSQDPVFAQHFVVEARAANRVRHPNVVDVHDVDFDGETPYIVQELLVGETLAEKLSQGALSLEQTLEILMPITRALAHAHACGLLHGDIKPENIFLSLQHNKLVPKLMDFGIARSIDSHAQSDEIVGGSPAYLAPELFLDSAGRDPRSDLWALGIVLFECLAGCHPFAGETPSELLSAICTEPPRALPFVGSEPLTAHLQKLISDCLQRNPDARIPDALKFLSRLEEADTAHRLSERDRQRETLRPDPAVRQTNSVRTSLMVTTFADAPADEKTRTTEPIPSLSAASLDTRTQPTKTSRATILAAVGLVVLALMPLAFRTLHNRTAPVVARPSLQPVAAAAPSRSTLPQSPVPASQPAPVAPAVLPVPVPLPAPTEQQAEIAPVVAQPNARAPRRLRRARVGSEVSVSSPEPSSPTITLRSER